ncbi:hypothetical protein PHYSODRAFT_534850 [Phytophthora sojae]|uniref:SWIM-type domain-containing protein n=1 Tax=Phytophthora sojae (strain P6497) TaxID=1094619 RepID=G5AH87_PHYSP|nr:hypothetical protein PHYSODRAFT_534850 [Phytophthora sojae]EGZ05066.1 hypothetical protein PHYSODRAFT_534850 [Phytophthora sojae]|eukprot:XP_009539438.1 hypothetical protein PHYSODRAFT_534850 [Phytophthora sojae]
MLPAHDGSTASMSGAAIRNFLKSKGADVSATSVSRMKQKIDDKIHGDLVEIPKLLERRTDRQATADMCEFTPLLEGAYSVLFKGPVAIPGYVHPDRVVDLPALECTCGNWQDQMFPCVHAICAASKDGRRIEDLHDAKRMSIEHFRDTYTFKFLPWPTTATLQRDDTILPPQLDSTPERIGKRGLKPGKRPQHKRKIVKNAL